MKVETGRDSPWAGRLAPWAIALAVLLQAWAYLSVLPLSLGPRVIMQPWLMGQSGYRIYEQVVDQHSPLMPLAISWLAPHSGDAWQLARLLLVVLLSASTLLVAWAAWRSAGRAAGVTAAWFFACWSAVFDFGKLWHESWLTPAYAALLLFYRPAGPRRSRASLVAAGLACGLAVFAKQQAALVVIAFVAWNLLTAALARRPMRELLFTSIVIGTTAAVPFSAYLGWHFWQVGSLDRVWFWLVEFNLGGAFAELAAKAVTFDQVWRLAPALLFVPAAAYRAARLKRAGAEAWESAGWGLTLLAVSLTGAWPRFETFHLQSALPALAWLTATALAGRSPSAVSEQGAPAFGWRQLAAGTTVGAWLLWVFALGGALVPALVAEGPRSTHEYTNLLPLADQIGPVVGPGASLYVFPDDEATANLYYLLRARPPKFWVFTYPWYMSPPTRRQIARTLWRDPPQWIVSPIRPGQSDASAPEVFGFIRANYRHRGRFGWEQGEVDLLERKP